MLASNYDDVITYSYADVYGMNDEGGATPCKSTGRHHGMPAHNITGTAR